MRCDGNGHLPPGYNFSSEREMDANVKNLRRLLKQQAAPVTDGIFVYRQGMPCLILVICAQRCDRF